jgi:beta-lactamase regulating signal transducer with metallopeptidase domain
MEWLTTYGVHSTALIAAVWLLTTIVPKLSLGTREALWKVALFGPLLTATIVPIAGVASVWGRLPMPQALRTEPVAAPQAVGVPQAVAAEPAVDQRIVRHRTGELEITAIRQRQPSPAPTAAPVPAAPAPASPSPWPMVLLGLWTAGAAVALGRLGWAAHRLRKQLHGRRDVIEDPVLESFLELCSKAGLAKRPRLTASPHLRSPIALGRREICLPERAVDSLTPPQQHGMLAHELAHLLRRDPSWTVAVAVVEAALWFQPLNHLARRKIQEVAEFQCDDWAARQAGTGVHLAKCLAEVAGWVEDGPPVGPAVTAMADRSSPIIRRITRLLHERRKGGRVHPVGRVAITVGTLGLVLAVVPGVSQAEGGSSAAAAPTPVLAHASASAAPRTVIFEDRSDQGHDRSRLRLHAGDEVVEIEVQAPRALPPPPPPPPPRGDRVEIMIHGHFGGPWGPWGWGSGWLGMLDLEGLGGLQILIEDGEAFEELFEDHWDHDWVHEHAERARERAEQARERAERARERAHERAEQAREHAERAEREGDAWSGIFGVAWDGEEPEDVEADEGCRFEHGCDVVEL